jgi:hypothetical protein
MNTNPQDLKASKSVLSPAEETLRLIASLPAPEGLESRLNAALNVGVYKSDWRRSRVLAWPRTLGLTFRPESSWMRTAAAAAIVFVVAGGGWGVYSRVESSRAGYAPVAQNQPAKVITIPTRMPVAGGFSGAGAIRTPVTLPGPAAPQHAKANPARPKSAKKPVTRPKAASTVSGQFSATGDGSPQPDAAK